MKKFKLWGIAKGVIICNLAIMAFVTAIYFGEIEELNSSFSTYDSFFTIIETLIRVTFLIFASVLMSRLVIEEYRNKTIQLMFMYPISRKRILESKLIIVFAFTAIVIFLSNTALDAIVILIDQVFYNIIPEELTTETIIKSFVRIVFTSLSAGGISLIPLYFGMRKYSVPTTIVSGILISSLISSNTNGFTLSNIIAIPIGLCLVGILIAYMTIRNVDTKDVV
ncbi:ABC transporter permease [Paenibacillus sp. YPG26]|uniref:ABC transporter permease n=1 Tax=Paenibacillus sp. YPG26 TaxID=2878915 RepID=UPI00203F4089|nr:ABC transporter permease [Paenibacillus sp. YPG26]USB33790.1 ABC transporter permease [Paenibacillus sp. YPG26]